MRTQLRLPLDDLLAVIREFIEPSMTRSALGRLLRVPSAPRGCLNRKNRSIPPNPLKFTCRAIFLWISNTCSRWPTRLLAVMSSSPRTRATRWVFLAVKRAKTPAAARSFLHALAKAAPVKIQTILTDNGEEFTDRVFGQEPKDATGSHEFDALCQALGIEHRLTKPKSPRTNGMVERFNGRLAAKADRLLVFCSAKLEPYGTDFPHKSPSRASIASRQSPTARAA